jgi:hypothetical protein
MRWLVLLVALVGVGGSALLGVGLMVAYRDGTGNGQADLAKGKAAIGDARFAMISRYAWSYVFFLAAAPLGLIAAFYALARRKYTAFLLFMLSVAGPYALAFPLLFELKDLTDSGPSMFKGQIGEIIKNVPVLPELVKAFILFTGALPLAGLLSLLIARPRPADDEEEA